MADTAPTSPAPGYAAIGLHDPKNLDNVGGVFRAAACFGAAMVAITGTRYHSQSTDTARAYREIPLLQVTDLHEIVPFDCIPVAVNAAPMPSPSLRMNTRNAPSMSLARRTATSVGPSCPGVATWCTSRPITASIWLRWSILCFMIATRSHPRRDRDSTSKIGGRGVGLWNWQGKRMVRLQR